MKNILSTGRPKKLSAGRTNIYHFLKRCQKYHASVSAVSKFDVTDLMQALAKAKALGQPTSLVSALVKAAALTVAKNPRINRHLFHGFRGPYEVQYGEVNCGLLVRRIADDGSEILFPAVIRNADQLSIDQISRKIESYKKVPLSELPEYRKFSKLMKLPRPVIPILSYKLRSDHRFFAHTIGATFGISSFAGASQMPMTPTQTLSPYGCSFLPGSIQERPWISGGEIRVRKILTLTSTFDHFLIDGTEGLAAMNDFKSFIESPRALGVSFI